VQMPSDFFKIVMPSDGQLLDGFFHKKTNNFWKNWI